MMKPIYNKMLFDNLGKVALEKGNSDNGLYAATALKNLEAYGYTVSEDFYEILKSQSVSDMKRSYDFILKSVKDTVGANASSGTVMYQNFPEEVMRKSDCELYLNALVHYWTGGTILPESEKEEKLPLMEQSAQLKMIRPGTEGDLHKLMVDRIYSQITLSLEKTEELRQYCRDYGDRFIETVNRPVPNKNNLAEVGLILYSLTIKENKSGTIKRLQKLFPNAVDVLRFAVAMSKEKYPDNDVFLDGKPRFKTFSWAEKRMLISMLANCKFLFEDIWKRKSEFKQLMRYINPKDIRSKETKRVEKAFDNLAHNRKLTEKGIPVRSANYRLNEALQNRDLTALTEVAVHYPGIFARQFVESLRKMPDKEPVARLYQEIGAQIPVKTTLNLMSYIGNSDNNQYRIFSSRYKNKNGIQQKYKAVSNLPLGLTGTEKFHIIRMLHESAVESLRGGSSLGKVYIDGALKNNKIAGNETVKSSSKGSRLTFGSVIPASQEKNVIRPFIWWTNLSDENINEYQKAGGFSYDNRVDIDLSAMCFDKDMNPKEHVSFTDLKTGFGCHSGDVVNGGPAGGNGVCEFIELDKTKLKEEGIAYVAVTVHAYTAVPFKYGVGQFGFMEREGNVIDFVYFEKDGDGDGCVRSSEAVEFESSTGEIFEPSTVKYKIDLTSDSVNTTPVIYDVSNDRFFWADRDLGHSFGFPTTEGTIGGSSAIAYLLTHSLSNNMYELMKCQAEARGAEIVDDITKADTVFISERIDAAALGLKEGADVISAFDLDCINAEFMGDLQKEESVLSMEEEKH